MTKSKQLGALLRALLAGPVAVDEAANLISAPAGAGPRWHKINRYRQTLSTMGFKTELRDEVITLTGGETLSALHALSADIRATQETVQ